MSFKGQIITPIGSQLGSWFHHTSESWTQIGNKYNFYGATTGTTDNIVGRYDTPPSTPYTVIAHINVNPTTTTAFSMGGGLGFSDGTKIVYFDPRSQANVYTSAWHVVYCDSSTHAASNLAGYDYAYGYPWNSEVGWMAIRNDGTNIYWYCGDKSGQNFYQIYSEAKGAHLGAITQIGLYWNNGTGFSPVDITVDSWKVMGV